jgi:hypothetical protein
MYQLKVQRRGLHGACAGTVLAVLRTTAEGIEAGISGKLEIWQGWPQNRTPSPSTSYEVVLQSVIAKTQSPRWPKIEWFVRDPCAANRLGLHMTNLTVSSPQGFPSPGV